MDLNQKMFECGELVTELHDYAKAYRKPPYGIEVEKTPELLEKAAKYISETCHELSTMSQRYLHGIAVKREGLDESYDILCPVCGYSVARNDDFEEMRPKHCPECGTKLLY